MVWWVEMIIDTIKEIYGHIVFFLLMKYSTRNILLALAGHDIKNGHNCPQEQMTNDSCK
jgi:hypothetical protein